MTEEKGIILLDMDDVLAEFNEEWVSRYNRDYTDNLSTEAIADWNASLFVKPECGTKIFDYFREPGIYRYLAPVEGAVEGVKELLRLGFEVMLVTDSPEGCSIGKPDFRGSNPADDKRAWVRENLPMIPIENIIITSKKWLVQGDILVDDKPATIEAFQERGRRIIAFDRPYNRGVDASLRAETWKDVVEIIKEQLLIKKEGAA